MDRIRVTLHHDHGHADAEARARLDGLFGVIRARFEGFNVEHKWESDAKDAATFSFARAGKGEGTGRASLAAGRLEVEIDARYKLPWLVPIVVAEKLVRDEFKKAVEEAFR